VQEAAVVSMAKKILIVNDELDVLSALKSSLERKKNFKVCVACDGEETLQKVEKESPDLIILDLGLLKLPGVEVCKKIRKNEKAERVPIIVLTGKTGDVDRIICRVIGVNYYMTKPFDLEKLLRIINDIFGIKNPS
jgi:DNA-binding response OmpR family regulator